MATMNDLAQELIDSIIDFFAADIPGGDNESYTYAELKVIGELALTARAFRARCQMHLTRMKYTGRSIKTVKLNTFIEHYRNNGVAQYHRHIYLDCRRCPHSQAENDDTVWKVLADVFPNIEEAILRSMQWTNPITPFANCRWTNLTDLELVTIPHFTYATLLSLLKTTPALIGLCLNAVVWTPDATLHTRNAEDCLALPRLRMLRIYQEDGIAILNDLAHMLDLSALHTVDFEQFPEEFDVVRQSPPLSHILGATEGLKSFDVVLHDPPHSVQEHLDLSGHPNLEHLSIGLEFTLDKIKDSKERGLSTLIKTLAAPHLRTFVLSLSGSIEQLGEIDWDAIDTHLGALESLQEFTFCFKKSSEIRRFEPLWFEPSMRRKLHRLDHRKVLVVELV